MKRLLAVLPVVVVLLIPAPRAGAVYGIPAQGPEVAEGGKFEIHPSIGLVAGDHHEFPWVADVDSFVIMPRLRYGISDSLQLDIHLGAMIGDYTALALGTGLMFQFVHQDRGSPLDVSFFVNLDLAIGELDYWRDPADVDATFLTLLSGVLLGHTFNSKGTELTPYGGLALGFTYFHVDVGVDDDDTDIAFDIILGFEVGFSKKYKVFTEFDIGPTDGMPALVWQLGLGYTF